MADINDSAKKTLWANHKKIRVTREQLRATNPNSIRLGVIGIIYSIAALLLAWPIAWLVVKGFTLAFSGILLMLVGNVLIIACCIMLPFAYIKGILLPCILYPINQLILNRRAIGWFSLFLAIATIIVGSVGVFGLILYIIVH